MAHDWLLRVLLDGDPGARALVDQASLRRHLPGPHVERVMLGGRCPMCGRGVVLVVLGRHRAAELEGALAGAGRCLHVSAPAPA